jgi:hypothetical protein
MKNYTLPLSLMLMMLTACTQPSSQISSTSISSIDSSSFSSILNSMSTSEIVSTSSSSMTSTSSSTSSTSSVLPSSSSSLVTSQSSSSTSTPLNSKWAISLGNISAQSFNESLIVLPVSLTSVGVTQAVSVYDKQTNTLYGYAFESVVGGFSGQINFRIGLRLDVFTGFEVVSDREHSGFGKVILAAFSTSITGVDVNYEAVLSMLASKFATRSGKTGTYDGVMPAIDAIIQYMDGL